MSFAEGSAVARSPSDAIELVCADTKGNVCLLIGFPHPNYTMVAAGISDIAVWTRSDVLGYPVVCGIRVRFWTRTQPYSAI
jgi:hypothetical protein